MDNMTNFFKIIFDNYLNTKDGEKLVLKIDETFDPFLDKLKEVVSAEKVTELEESLMDCYAEAITIASVKGMELATKIMNDDAEDLKP